METDGHPAAVADEAARMEELAWKNGAMELRVAKDEAESIRLAAARRSAFSALARVAPTTILEDATVPRSELANMIRFVEQVAQRLKGFGFMEDVRDGREWVQKLDSIRNVTGLVGLVIGLAFAAVAVVIIGVTIRLTLLQRAREISVMRLVGATNWFIRGPFLLEGALKGLLGGFLSLLLCYAGYLLFRDSSGGTFAGLVFFRPEQMLLILVFGLLLGLFRQIPAADASLKRGQWDKTGFKGRELRGKTIGILGLGKIGRAVARRALAFEMTCVGYDPLLSEDATRALEVEPLSLDELLPRSEILTLHVPLLPETRGMIGAIEIARLPRGAVIVNAARGGLVDEAAVLDALERGHLGGAVFDVFAQEPPGASPLVQRANVVVTPHIGAATVEAQEAVGEEIVKLLLGKLRETGAIG